MQASIAVLEVIGIIFSGGALNAGVKGAAKLFAIIDISVSTINLALFSDELKAQLNKTEAGRWFVSYWPIISLCLSAGTISYYLAKGVIKYNKQLKQQLQNEPQLSKQIDELVEESKKVAELDYLANVSGRGRRLGQRWSNSSLNQLANYLKKQKVDFEIFPEKGSFEIKDFFDVDGMPAILTNGKQAAFVYTAKEAKFVVRDGATLFETLHEFMHFKHSKKIGLKNYHSLGGADTAGELLKEQHVFDKMIEYKDLLTKDELKWSLAYLNKYIYNPRGINPIDFSFDINKIPEVRKEIDIRSIFNLK